jgi:inorganic phosphate transporter, PiT family
MDAVVVMTIVGVVLVLAFDVTNGFHDASNMLSSLVATRAMTPAQAVVIVAVFTVLGPLLGGTAVANTIASVVELRDLPARLALGIVASGVGAAIGWNLLTWWRGLPSSSSHALIGGLAGAALAGPGAHDVVWGFAVLRSGELSGVAKVLFALLVSPLLGFAAGFALQRLMRFVLRAAHPRIDTGLRRAQWFTAAGLAFAHGTNDAQKGMGIIALLLVLGGFLPAFHVPIWVMVASALCITFGTLLGGWRIVRTMGFQIYRLRPLHGLDVQLASILVVLGASALGGPVSTTHLVGSSTMGVGAAERPRAVHWGKAEEIALAWLVTLPGAAALGYGGGLAVTWLTGSGMHG